MCGYNIMNFVVDPHECINIMTSSVELEATGLILRNIIDMSND